MKTTWGVDSQKGPSGIHNAVFTYLPCSLRSVPPWPDRPRPFGNLRGGRERPPFLRPRCGHGVGWVLTTTALSGGRSRPFESIPAGRRSRFGSLRIGSGRCPARGQELRPLFHQDAPALEQVRAGIGRFHLIPDFHFGRSSANYRIASDAFYLYGFARIGQGEEANTEWVKSKTSRFSCRSTGF